MHTPSRSRRESGPRAPHPRHPRTFAGLGGYALLCLLVTACGKESPEQAPPAAPQAGVAAEPVESPQAESPQAAVADERNRAPSAQAALKPRAPGQPMLFRLRDTLKALGMNVRGIQQDEGAVRVTLEATAHDRNDDELLLSWAKAFGVLSHAGSPLVVLNIEMGGQPTMVLEAQTKDIQAVTSGKRSVRDFMASLRLQAAEVPAAAPAAGPAAGPPAGPAVAPAAGPPAAPAAGPVAAPAAGDGAPAGAAILGSAPPSAATAPLREAPKHVAPKPAVTRSRSPGPSSRPAGRVSRPSGASSGPSRPGRPARPSR